MSDDAVILPKKNYYMNNIIQNQIYKATPHSKKHMSQPIKSNEQAAMPT